MALDFSATNAQRVDWGALSSVQQLQNKTVLVWCNLDTTTDGDFIGSNPTGGLTTEFWSFFIDSGTGKLGFFVNFNTTDGRWLVNSVPSTGALHLFGVTYNYTSISNDPVFYIDGVAVAFTETSTPAGSYQTGVDNALRVGAVFSTSFPSFDGRLFSTPIYNRIFTPSEMLNAYQSKLAIPDWNGLVFAPNLSKADGLTTFDGTTLGSSNFMYDMISGAKGTPNASPIARADTALVYQGVN